MEEARHCGKHSCTYTVQISGKETLRSAGNIRTPYYVHIVGSSGETWSAGRDIHCTLLRVQSIGGSETWSAGNIRAPNHTFIIVGSDATWSAETFVHPLIRVRRVSSGGSETWSAGSIRAPPITRAYCRQ